MEIYYFTAAEWGIEAIRKKRLKISEISHLNDPFEFIGVNLKDKMHRRAINGFREDFAKQYGIICFSDSWRNPLMWAHYAKNHTGICLCFEALIEDFASKVNYQESRFTAKELSLDAPAAITEASMQKLLTTKFSHWRYESEYRAFCSIETRDTEKGLYFFDYENILTLKTVFCGFKFNEPKRDVELALEATSQKAKIIKTRPAFQEYRIVQNRNKAAWD